MASLDRDALLADRNALLSERDQLRISLNQTQARLQQVALEKDDLIRSYYCSLRGRQKECKSSYWVETIQTISFQI